MRVSGFLGFCSVGVILALPIITHGQNTSGKCMGELGCFPITSDFFHILYRPVNLNPADRESINTTFWVYTQGDPKTPFAVRANEKTLLQASGFDAKKNTKIIVHGFIHKVFEEWMMKLKDEYLLNGDYNVILVDWSGGDGLPYTQAAANTRVVAAEITLLLNWLKASEGLKLEDCHILGHSLGSHIAGYVGQKTAKLGRITAMDPAQPYFQNMPASVRLDPTDANFVDVIHTDIKTILIFGLGMSQLVGHVDFFPNDGQDQPGCKPDNLFNIIMTGVVTGIKEAVGCNHHRAIKFALESVNRNRCVFTGYSCPSWDMFLQGMCADCGPKGDKCAHMGDKAPQLFLKHKNDSVQNKFYLKTDSVAPFCLYHYHVTVLLEKDSKAKDQEGTVTLILQGDKMDQVFKLANGEKIKFYHGSSSSFLVTTPNDLGDISSATFKWDGGFSLIPWTTKEIYLKSIKIVPMNVIEPSGRAAGSRLLCTGEKNTVASRTETALKKC